MSIPSSAPVSLPARAGIGDAPGKRSDDVLRPEPILGRRDVALTPWVAIGCVALSFAISQTLRDGVGTDLIATWVGAGTIAAICGIVTALIDVPVFVPLRTSMAVYVVGAGGLIAVLSAIGVVSDGLRTVVLTGEVLEAMYLGLVLTVPGSGGFMVVMLATMAGVHAAKPDADLLGALSVFALTFTAWGLGVLCRTAHQRAERTAMRLTRCDLLTATLNRRGLMEELEVQTRRARADSSPVALMIFDLDGFKAVNTQRGNAAGDELLAWVGGVLGALLPTQASAGRLGSDEFAVAITGLDRNAAGALADELRIAIGERHPVSVGVATAENGLVNGIDLVRVADAAMRVCKADPEIQVHSLVVGGFRSVVQGPAGGETPPRLAITYRQLRKMGGRPQRPQTGAGMAFGWLVRWGYVVIGSSGVAVVALTFASPGDDVFFTHVVEYLGIPWILANYACAFFFSGSAATSGRQFVFIAGSSAALTGLGIGAAALSTGQGIVAPMVIGLSLKVGFDAAIAVRGQARYSLSFFVIVYLTIAALGPSDVLWAAPVGLTQLGAAFALGSLSRRALDDTTAQWVHLGRSDVLTGLANRAGFDEDSHLAIDAARAENRRIAFLALDLDGFKQVNEAGGPAAGDALLQRVADVIRAVLSDAAAAGRLGGDEFVAAVPVRSLEEADQLGELVERAIGGVIGTSVGCAVFPDDGADVETLVRAADLRCRAVKAARLDASSA